MPVLETLGIGVVANFAYRVAKDAAPKRVKRLVPALFFGGDVSLTEIDNVFENIKKEIIEEYKHESAVNLFLGPEKTIKGGVLDPLFRKVFLGEKADNRSLDRNFFDCIPESDKRAHRAKYRLILDDIIQRIEREFLRNPRTANYTLAVSLDEVKNTLNYIRSMTEKSATDLQNYAKAFSIESEFDRFSKSYLGELKSVTENIYIKGLEMITRSPEHRQSITHSFVPIYVRYLPSNSNFEESIPIESHNASDLIDRLERIIIRGPAGSGKTTLMQWIIWNCDPFDEHPKNENRMLYFPIYIPLRRLEQSGTRSYTFNQVVADTLPSDYLQKHIPLGWIEDLASRDIEILILIDGVDELPEAKRAEVWSMVKSISKKFENAKIVITSRHVSSVHLADGRYRTDLFESKEALEVCKKLWNKPEDFFEFVVTPLSNSDIIQLIDKWFSGVDPSLVPHGDLDRLQLYPELLKEEIFQDRHRSINELSRTPLLCSLICMSFLFQRGKFPESKKEIYEYSVNLLVSVRDEARNLLPPIELRNFDIQLRLDLLKYIALIMQEGAQITALDQTVEVHKEQVLSWILAWKKQKPQLTLKKEKYFEYLVDRCALIREPSYERVDFIHRSFMEYLAAERIAEVRQPFEIREKIRRDEWQNTLQFCMSTKAGGSYYGAQLLQHMYEFVIDTIPEEDRRKFFLRIASFSNFMQGPQIAASDTLETICMKTLPLCASGEVDDLLSVPYEVLKNYLRYSEIETKFTNRQIAFIVDLLCRHEDERTKDILRSGYHRIGELEIVKKINLSGKLNVKEHVALAQRLRNRSYKDTVCLTPDELRVRAFRAGLARSAWIRFSGMEDEFIGWDFLTRVPQIRLSYATLRDFEVMKNSVNVWRFDSCRYLEIEMGYGFAFDMISFLFPIVESVLLQKCAGFSLDEMQTCKKLKELWVEDCTQRVLLSRESIPDSLENIVFNRSLNPVVLDKSVESKVVMENRDRMMRGFPSRY